MIFLKAQGGRTKIKGEGSKIGVLISGQRDLRYFLKDARTRKNYAAAANAYIETLQQLLESGRLAAEQAYLQFFV